MEFLKITLTSLLSVAALFITTKLMGHKQVAQLDFFDYVSGITIGSIGAELAIDLESPWRGLLALGIYGAISVLLGKLTHKLPKTRKFINGTPTIIMAEGKLYRENMKKSKLDLSEFLLMCREIGYFDLCEIEVAVFEHNGKLSVLPKSDKRPLTPSDMKILPPKAHVGCEVIMDGRIMGENLTRIGRDEAWLKKRLSQSGYGGCDKIFLGIYYEGDDRLSLYPV